MTIAEFDHLTSEKKKELLLQCCGSSTWAKRMLDIFPVEDLVELLEGAEEIWYDCNESDWREAFEHHPQIGDINSLKEKFASTAAWAAGEQSGVNHASENILNELAEANKNYKEKFGYIFIVCATGKSAQEMLSLIKQRLNNTAEQEIEIAMSEQNKITKLRLEKLFGVIEN
ncbi:MAG: 2-oxo-4-hydroxy-4-carboxy-5-ureidoimidazoline decarboxylase [Bacteroidota bacterium]|nr:2-oxo-4-hydroxy-4-carboxy-5-ureidoimidazoline decarboxylase [Bacteroidota bacterium]